MMTTSAKSPKAAKPVIPVWSWTQAIAIAKVPPPNKLVCLNIARYLSDAGRGWRISVKQMIADTGLSNTSIAAHLQNAVDAGLLVIQRMPGPNGQRGVTLYKPRFPDGVERAREPVEMPGEEGSPGSGEPSETGSRGPREGGSPRPRQPREAGSSRPSEGASRQEPFHQVKAFHKKTSPKKEALQERERADARPSPKADVDVVEAEFVELEHAEPAERPKKASQKLVAVKAPKPSRQGHRLPETWTPGDEGLRFALELGLTQRQVKSEFEKFCDYWRAQPGSKGRKLDWLATWRNWVRRATEHRPHAPARSARADLSTFL